MLNHLRSSHLSTSRLLIIILILSVTARLLAVFILGDRIERLPGIDDQRSYDMLARQVLAGRGFTVAHDWWPLTRAGEPTAHWSYLYTSYLAAIYFVSSGSALLARVVQAILVGVFMPLLIFRLGRRLRHERAGLIAAACCALYGYFIYYAAALMTESFYITAILWSIDLALALAADDRSIKRWALLGLSIGLAALLRQTFLLLAPIVLLAACDVRWRDFKMKVAGQKLSRKLKGCLVSVIIIIALIVPWTLRNYQAFQRLVVLNTNAGFAFFWSNHPIYGTQFVGILPAGTSYQSLIPAELRSLDEAALDSALMQRGLEFVTQDIGRYALLSFSRLATYFQFWPSNDSSLLSNIVRVLSFGVLLPVALFGLIRTLRDWRRWWLLYTFVIVYSLIHLLSWALIRYRLPVDAILILFAANGLVRETSLPTEVGTTV